MVSVLLSASVKRCFVSRMRDFFFNRLPYRDVSQSSDAPYRDVRQSSDTLYQDVHFSPSSWEAASHAVQMHARPKPRLADLNVFPMKFTYREGPQTWLHNRGHITWASQYWPKIFTIGVCSTGCTGRGRQERGAVVLLRRRGF